VTGEPWAVQRSQTGHLEVALPAGRFEVELTYVPPWLGLALVLFAASFATLLFAVWRERRLGEA
jgi:uncharacterized membrane protein YfhO